MCQYVTIFKHRFLTYTLNQCLVELLLVVPFDDHDVDLVFKVVVGFFLGVLVKESQPLLDVAYVLV